MRSPYVMRSRLRDKMPHLTHQICRTRLIETSFECHHLTRRENLVLGKPGVPRRLLVTEICRRFALGLLASCSLTVPGPPMDGAKEGYDLSWRGRRGRGAAGHFVVARFHAPWTVQILRQPDGQLSCLCNSGCIRDAVRSCHLQGLK